MYQVLLAVWAALYGGSTADLAAADYRVRDAATKTLRAAGWFAYPALCNAARSTVEERRVRADDLLRSNCRPSAHVRDCLGVLAVLGRRGGPHPTDAEYDWLWAEGRRSELFKQLCVNLNLYRPDLPFEFVPPSVFWWGATGRGEWIAVMRMRAAGTPLAWPTDPFGPKEVIPKPKEVRGGEGKDEADQGRGNGGGH